MEGRTASLWPNTTGAVRASRAENIAVLAETALRYLEMVQLGQAVQKEDIAADEPEDLLHVRGSYDTGGRAAAPMKAIRRTCVTCDYTVGPLGYGG